MAWDEKDWRFTAGKMFVLFAKQRGIPANNRGLLTKLIYELEQDSTVPDEFRKQMRQLSLQSVRAQSNFVTGVLNRFWENEIPDLGRGPQPGENFTPQYDQPVQTESQDWSQVKAGLAQTAAQVPSASPVPKIEISKQAPVQKLKPIELVLTLKFADRYDSSHVRDILRDWFAAEFPDQQLELLDVAVAGTTGLWHDLKLKTSVLYPILRKKIVQVNWIKECVSKPASEFGHFMASVE